MRGPRRLVMVLVVVPRLRALLLRLVVLVLLRLELAAGRGSVVRRMLAPMLSHVALLRSVGSDTPCGRGRVRVAVDLAAVVLRGGMMRSDTMARGPSVARRWRVWRRLPVVRRRRL